MPGFNIVSTNHTSFTVSNLDRTLAFFSEALGSRSPQRHHAIPMPSNVSPVSRAVTS